MQAQRLRCFGHINRITSEKMIRKVFKYNSVRTKPKGITKIRWEDDTVNYIKFMKISNWIGCVQKRKMWK